MIIQLLNDNAGSWIVPYTAEFLVELRARGFEANQIFSHDQIEQGDILALLGCEEILSDQNRRLNRHTLVVHESALPQGKGWSPLTWQILEGKNEIPITLFEASATADAGPIYYQEFIILKGHELIDEIRALQAHASFALLRRFLEDYPNVRSNPQCGQESFYSKRGPEDSRVDTAQSISSQFNKFRVVDNERYPAFFEYAGRRYKLKIESME